MAKRDLERRIEDLERQVRELQARPPIVINNPPPVVYPSLPLPAPWPQLGEITYSAFSIAPTTGPTLELIGHGINA